MIDLATTDSDTSSAYRVAIISDTHGSVNSQVLHAISSCEQIVHAGDICGAHVLSQLNELCTQVTAVAGNNDAPGLWAEIETQIVAALPEVTQLELPGGILAIEHGHLHGMHKPDHASLRAAHPEARAIVYGHTHVMLVDEQQSPWVVNPGAAGATRTNGGPSCLILSIENDHWDFEMLRFENELAA